MNELKWCKCGLYFGDTASMQKHLFTTLAKGPHYEVPPPSEQIYGHHAHCSSPDCKCHEIRGCTENNCGVRWEHPEWQHACTCGNPTRVCQAHPKEPEVRGPSSITITNTEGITMQIKIGQTVHFIRERRGNCRPAIVVSIPTIEDPDNPGSGNQIPDQELGTLNLQVFGQQGGYDIADYSPDLPMPNTWHTLDECENENMAIDVVDK